MNKAIPNVEPYNQFALRDCYFSMIFPAVNAFSGSADALAIVTNNDIVFSYDKERFRQEDTRNSRNNLDNLLAEQNIKLEKDNTYHTDIVDFVCGEIDKGHLVVASLVDSLAYDPNTGDETAGHAGFGHWVLIYGYDDEKRVLNVIDHFRVESPIYCKLLMNFDELKRSYDKHNEDNGSRLQILSRLKSDECKSDLKNKYCQEWINLRKAREQNPVTEYLNFIRGFFDKGYLQVKRQWFFVAEDIVRLNSYYLQQKYILNHLSSDKEMIKRIDRQTQSILKFKQKLFEIRQVKTEEDFVDYKTKFDFVDDFVRNGFELEEYIDNLTI